MKRAPSRVAPEIPQPWHGVADNPAFSNAVVIWPYVPRNKEAGQLSFVACDRELAQESVPVDGVSIPAAKTAAPIVFCKRNSLRLGCTFEDVCGGGGSGFGPCGGITIHEDRMLPTSVLLHGWAGGVRDGSFSKMARHGFRFNSEDAERKENG